MRTRSSETAGSASAIRIGIALAAVVALLASGAYNRDGRLLAQQPRALRIADPTVLLPDHAFGRVSRAAIALSDGSVFLLDDLNQEVLKVGSDARLQWRVGRKGEGPGEFRFPDQLAATPSGGVAVLDRGLNRLTIFSAAGKLVVTRRFPFTFRQVDGLAVTKSGEVVVAGTTVFRPAAPHSIHVFSEGLRYLRSFGEHSVARDSMSARSVGAGGIALTPSGTLLFTRKRPFEIHRFDLSGRQLARISVAIPLAMDLSDIVAVTTYQGRTIRSIAATAREVELPVPAVPAPGGGFLTGKLRHRVARLDLVSDNGTLESSLTPPLGASAILAIDPQRSVFYASNPDESTVVRVAFKIERR